MKHLLTGVAVVAALATAAPGWAQNPPPPAPAMPAAPAANSAMPPMHHAVRHAHAMHHFHKGMAEKAASTGDTTAQLNRQELSRIQVGGTPAPGPAMPGK